MNKEKTIFNDSPYEQGVKMVLQGVTGDKAKIVTPESAGGDVWESKCVDVQSDAGRFVVTHIKKNGKKVGKIVYSYDTGEEHEVVAENDGGVSEWA